MRASYTSPHIPLYLIFQVVLGEEEATNYEAQYYAVLFSLLPVYPSFVQIPETELRS
jgi:hypothetical protein